MRSRLFVVIAVLCSITSTACASHWVATWSAAPYLVGATNMPPSPGLTNNTLRQIVRVSIGGDTLRLTLTNVNNTEAVAMKSVNIAVAKTGSAIDASTLTPLKFGGSASATLNAGSAVTSDPVAFKLNPDTRVAITIVYGATASNMTGHVGSRTLSYVVAGDKATAADLSGAASTPHWYSINTIDVRAPDNAAVVAALGNSITDGYGLVNDLQNRWTDFFSKALLANNSTKQVAVVNMGIGGTNVLGTCQTCGEARFARDILGQAGLGWVILFYGTNDIDAGASAANLIAGYTNLAKQAKAKGAKVYGATITPFKGNKYHTTAHEQVRRTVNTWIRGGGAGNYDGIIDFDLAIRNPSDTEAILAKYNNDGLHPNAAGYQRLGEYIPVSMFVNTSGVRQTRKTTLAEMFAPKASIKLKNNVLSVEYEARRPDGGRITAP